MLPFKTVSQMTALPIKGLQQSFKAGMQKFEQQIIVAVECL